MRIHGPRPEFGSRLVALKLVPKVSTKFSKSPLDESGFFRPPGKDVAGLAPQIVAPRSIVFKSVVEIGVPTGQRAAR